LRPSEIDIYVPELKLGVEYDGAAWHIDSAKDSWKSQICKDHGVAILHVREPKCPVLPNNCWTYVRKDRKIDSLGQMTRDVLMIIEDSYKTGIMIDVNFSRDHKAILLEYLANRGQKSVGDHP